MAANCIRISQLLASLLQAFGSILHTKTFHHPCCGLCSLSLFYKLLLFVLLFAQDSVFCNALPIHTIHNSLHQGTNLLDYQDTTLTSGQVVHTQSISRTQILVLKCIKSFLCSKMFQFKGIWHIVFNPKIFLVRDLTTTKTYSIKN